MSEDRSLGVTPILHLMQDQTLGTKSKPDWSHLAPDLRFYLDYYCEHITHWKYGVHKDPDDVFHTTFISFALQSEPLLYALVSFAAFKRMLNNPEGKIHDFLQYYTPSVTLLLGLLQNHETKHDVPTLLTILQLATMEVRPSLSTRQHWRDMSLGLLAGEVSYAPITELTPRIGIPG